MRVHLLFGSGSRNGLLSGWLETSLQRWLLTCERHRVVIMVSRRSVYSCLSGKLVLFKSNVLPFPIVLVGLCPWRGVTVCSLCRQFIASMVTIPTLHAARSASYHFVRQKRCRRMLVGDHHGPEAASAPKSSLYLLRHRNSRPPYTFSTTSKVIQRHVVRYAPPDSPVRLKSRSFRATGYATIVTSCCVSCNVDRRHANWSRQTMYKSQAGA